MTTEDVAKIAYQAYGEVTEFKNYQGLPMPTWEELPDKIKTAWRAAAMSVQIQMAQRVLEGTAHYIAQDTF